MFVNPTRRKGRRTGGIPVPKALVEKILRQIFSNVHVVRTMLRPQRKDAEAQLLAAIFGEDQAEEHVTFVPTELGGHKFWSFTIHDTIQSYVTGKRESLEVSVRDLERDKGSPYSGGVAGWQSSGSADPVNAGKAERVERVKKALVGLGLEPSPAMVRKVFAEDPSFAVFSIKPTEKRTVQVNLAVKFMTPMPRRALEDYFRSTLVHEIAHGLDEGLRMRHVRRSKESEEEDRLFWESEDAEEVAELLGLPLPTHPRKEAALRRLTDRKVHFKPTKEYYERPSEVTARIAEIFSEVDRRLKLFKAMVQQAPVERAMGIERPRAARLLKALRTVSATFKRDEKNWDEASLARVLRAVYDRYHHEKWFPKATGVYKNRRTSRRRTSRRR